MKLRQIIKKIIVEESASTVQVTRLTGKSGWYVVEVNNNRQFVKVVSSHDKEAVDTLIDGGFKRQALLIIKSDKRNKFTTEQP